MGKFLFTNYGSVLDVGDIKQDLLDIKSMLYVQNIKSFNYGIPKEIFIELMTNKKFMSYYTERFDCFNGFLYKPARGYGLLGSLFNTVLNTDIFSDVDNRQSDYDSNEALPDNHYMRWLFKTPEKIQELWSFYSKFKLNNIGGYLFEGIRSHRYIRDAIPCVKRKYTTQLNKGDTGSIHVSGSGWFLGAFIQSQDEYDSNSSDISTYIINYSIMGYSMRVDGKTINELLISGDTHKYNGSVVGGTVRFNSSLDITFRVPSIDNFNHIHIYGGIYYIPDHD